MRIVHSNWTGTEGGKWKNEIKNDVIEELWMSEDYRLYNDFEERVVFAKSKMLEDQYVFLGVYKAIDVRGKNLPNGKSVWVKTYKRFSDVYPKKTRKGARDEEKYS